MLSEGLFMQGVRLDDIHLRLILSCKAFNVGAKKDATFL